MIRCSQRTLDPRALAYIRESLAEGHTLASYLLQRPDLEGGAVTTFVPDGVTDEAAHQFSYGGILPEPPADTHVHVPELNGSVSRMVPVPNTDPYLVQLIERFLRTGAGRICIFEEPVG